MITDYLPSDQDLNCSVWSKEAIAELSYNQFGVKLDIRITVDYLKRWNFTPQKTTKWANQRDIKKVVEWRDTYPKIQAQAEEDDGIIHFGDEAGIYTEQMNNRSYGPKGKPQKLNLLALDAK
jgi:hypothetical protein